MPKDKRRTYPILADVNGAKKVVCYLQIAKDSSVYVYFPREKGYVASYQKQISGSIGLPVRINLDENREQSSTPHISYHPGNNSIHVNFRTGEKYRLDVPARNIGEPEKPLLPIGNMMIPYFGFFDPYRNKKYHSLRQVVRMDNEDPPDTLGIELYVHLETHKFSAVEIMKHTKLGRQVISIATYSPPRDGELSLTVVLKHLFKEHTMGRPSGIIASIPSDSYPFVFELFPADNPIPADGTVGVFFAHPLLLEEDPPPPFMKR